MDYKLCKRIYIYTQHYVYVLIRMLHMYVCTYVPLCVGGSKGKAGIHLKYYPENRDTFEMYPGKVMHMIGG